jgi:hypothetical protein
VTNAMVAGGSSYDHDADAKRKVVHRVENLVHRAAAEAGVQRRATEAEQDLGSVCLAREAHDFAARLSG